MPVLQKAGASGALDNLNISQANFRAQIGVVADALRQIIGNANVDSTSATAGLLNSRYALYVNPVTGSDEYASGIYDAATTPPIVNQQLTSGYTPQRPFKTLSRALIEAARLSIQAGPGNDTFDRVVIHCSAGEHIIDNATGLTTIVPWTDGTPSAEQLRAFNSVAKPGLILPRGVSIVGEDLRKTVIRPAYVPPGNGNATTGRSAIFRITGGSFFFNFTFKDAIGANSSHHLLSCFEFCSSSDLQTYYDKIETAFSLDTSASEVRSPETEIVGPAPDSNPTSATDTTEGSSPYIFNCSVRSDYGLCGVYLDGSQVSGFRSVVIAQFTNISLQKDITAWQKYVSGSWLNVASYAEYISTSVSSLRPKTSGEYNVGTGTYATDYRHFAFKAINGAFIQEVSNFVIGNAVHHWTASGGEISMNNSNSSFGSCALLSDGFRGVGTATGALPQDTGFAMMALRRPTQIKTDGTNIREITLGRLSSNAYVSASGYIELDDNLDIEAVLTSQGYSLKEDHYIWIENRNKEVGPGYNPADIPGSTAINVRAQLAATPFNPAFPNRIYIKNNGNNNISTIGNAELADNRVFIRRLVDTRRPEDREFALIISNSNITTSRRPVGNYVLRLGAAGSTANQLDPTNGANELYLVSDVNTATVSGGLADTNYYRITLRPGDAAAAFTGNQLYRAATPITYNNKVYRRREPGSEGSFDSSKWAQSVVILPDGRGIEYSRSGIAPLITLDKDLSNSPTSTTLGITFNTDSDYLGQLRSSTDYVALAALLQKIGYSTSDIGTSSADVTGKILAPQSDTSLRDWSPTAGSSPTPNGKLTSKTAWPLEFNRPSLVRAFGQAFEWVGYGNYTKALPKYQVEALTDQAIIDALFINLRGGRVYATGFTEDGLLVQGDQIRDLTSGRDLSVESVGLGGLTGDQYIPTYFDSSITIGGNLTVDEDVAIAGNLEVSDGATVTGPLTVTANSQFSGNLVVNGTISGGAVDVNMLPFATTTQKGVIQLATPAETAGLSLTTRAVTPNSLAQALSELAAVLTPVGTVLYVARSTAPAGWLKANGAPVSRTTYANLFAVLGTAYGAGDGVSTFNLPDLRGEFIRAWDDSRGVDSGRTLGSAQSDLFKSHTHSVTDPGHSHSINLPLGQKWDLQGNDLDTPNLSNTNYNTNTATTGISIQNTGGTETRPRNVALLAIIKH